MLESPWIGHFQEGLGAEEFQPLLDPQDPLDHYLQIRDSFDRQLKALQAPIGCKFPPTVALRAIVEKNHVPLITEWVASLALQCQLALLLAIVGDRQAAEKLAGQLAPVVLGQFWTLWTSEKEYDEEETRISCALFLRAIGRIEEADRLYASTLLKSPFFTFLFKQNVQIDSVSKPLEQIAWTLNSKFSLGAMRFGTVQIPAFGPHAAPLTNPSLFGIVPHEKNWFCSSALKDVWFQIEPHESSFSLQAIGVEKPLAFVFYVIAEECRIGERIFKPKNLNRFLGEGTVVHFDKVFLEVDRSLKIELIPLSGDRSYWGAGFLLAYWLPPASTKLLFRLK